MKVIFYRGRDEHSIKHRDPYIVSDDHFIAWRAPNGEWYEWLTANYFNDYADLCWSEPSEEEQETILTEYIVWRLVQ